MAAGHRLVLRYSEGSDLDLIKRGLDSGRRVNAQLTELMVLGALARAAGLVAGRGPAGEWVLAATGHGTSTSGLNRDGGQLPVVSLGRATPPQAGQPIDPVAREMSTEARNAETAVGGTLDSKQRSQSDASPSPGASGTRNAGAQDVQEATTRRDAADGRTKKNDAQVSGVTPRKTEEVTKPVTVKNPTLASPERHEQGRVEEEPNETRGGMTDADASKILESIFTDLGGIAVG